MPINTAAARWEGNLTEGSGWMKTGKGGLQGNYSFQSRFEEGAGTNPEELIAAAHAGCFSMAFSNGLSQAGFVPTSVDTTARVALEKTDAGFAITRIELETKGDVPGIDESTFQKIAEDAKANCPISRLLSPGADISLSAKLA
jgi:osmotically inducible protein OsmC